MAYTMERATLALKLATARLQSVLTLAEEAKVEADKRTELFEAYEMACDAYQTVSEMNKKVILDDSDASGLETFFSFTLDADKLFRQIKAIYVTLDRPPVANEYLPRVVSEPKMTSRAGSLESVHSNSGSGARCNVKLPRINLPTFDGCLKTWPTFYDLFNTLINGNDSLSDIERFQYLIASLSKEPLALVKHLPLTSDNYAIAYGLLIERYQNDRVLVTFYWQSVVNAPKATADSAPSLRALLNTFTENISALGLYPHVDLWDFTLLNWFLQKLDSSTRKRFELKFANSPIPRFEDLRQFIAEQCRALETCSFAYNPTTSSQSHIKMKQPSSSSTKALVANVSSSPPTPRSGSESCSFCEATHSSYRCPTFIGMAGSERQAAAKKARLCYNCLSPSHVVSKCSSSVSCRTCNKRHHSLLHLDKSLSNLNSMPSQPSGATESAPTTSSNVSSNTTVLHSKSHLGNVVLLATALVNIRDEFGDYRQCRVLLDPGSQASFIVDSCARKLGLQRSRTDVSVFGLGNSISNSPRGVACCQLRTRSLEGYPDRTFTVDAIILPTICANLPNSQLPSKGWSYLNGLRLADPNWHKPTPVDMLLGADLYPSLIQGGQISPPVDMKGPTALNTCLGWVLLGPTTSALPSPVNAFFTSLKFPVEETLRKFWEVEQVPSKSCISADEAKAEDIFKSTHSRDHFGRFAVCLPFATPNPSFGDTLTQADRRLASLERRLSSQPVFRDSYVEFMKDYLTSGHMSLLSTLPDKGQAYFIPHHGVFKTDGDTSKIRVVFDASAKDVNGLSLNDTQLVGPKLQSEISSILLLFRSHTFVFTCDVRQMFRQIRVTDRHCQYQLIRWRFSPAEPVQTYQLNTVTYGVSSSPFLAIRTLLQLASESAAQFPLAAKALQSSLYVDDLACGGDTISEALNLRDELVQMFATGCLELRKWSSNHPSLLEGIPASHCQSQDLSFDGDTDTLIKVLGLQWQSSVDSFSFKVKPIDSPCTKRAILSEVARIYDPLGFLGPVTIFAKRLIQHLWILGIDWDEPPPDEVCAQWTQYKSELGSLSSVKIPRLLVDKSVASCQLHAFCDASEVGYAGVVYLRVVDDTGRVTTRLVMSKSKVAPVKRLSIPRLELCAAVLLSNLISFVITTYKDKVNFEQIVAWSDSTVALHWVKSSPHRWKTFVANRVCHIQEKVPPECWRHVNSSDNPADPASRGLFPEGLLSCSLWWAGPSWLAAPCDSWPNSSFRQVSVGSEIEERRIVLTVGVETTVVRQLLHKFSSLRKILAVVAYCLRFVNNAKGQQRITGPLSEFEYHKARVSVVRVIQAAEFPREIEAVRKGAGCPKFLRKLAPFLDEDNVLRVGGRLANSDLNYSSKHPALLPSTHRFTELLIEDIHLRYFHAGLSTTLHLIQQNFWILGGRRSVRRVLSKCQRCFRLKPIPMAPRMGNLLAHRVSQAKPFSVVGVDYAGPFSIVARRARGTRPSKCYLCLFVCFATKALHLELASDLSTEAFLGALRRFIARRGRCSLIFSDCGTNFVGAQREMTKLFKLASEKETITWQFNPPSSPHFGGLWESGVKSVKTHLSRVVGLQILTYEELNTLVIQVEALLNSRPLCALSTDPNDLRPLTPGHFLTLDLLTAPPDPDLSHLSLSRLSRWQLIQRLQQDFWARWKTEYLHTLHQRGKWHVSKAMSDSDIGKLVLIKEDNTSTLKWRLGRIVSTHPGKDGIARVATVKTASGCLKRPFVKLCPLPDQ